ncbi:MULTISPECIES: hypothetical protein [Klebsiella pneumoniae complex]|uniref:hypothetical protein n=1 Tax=Klebsiella pneumoniae complex TaxID=3390273 RepID=UPI0004A837BA|nr:MULTISPECIES: hypothetical protein [Klebsiella]EIY5075194.1 hypothetical protein [Klebsiella quasipneumoniae]HDT5694058.1 hypothetical protein [Klebsiella quasipneumoniae subsp. similipneumoniae]AID99039.1 hypothetical protein A593_00185 [Klebsiella variicola]MDM9244017.1 hypothetical protein [Klebsiella pneumoniae]OZJ15476.1 hypothetical protein CEP04_11310 [Klebsiella pneumoniae]
MHLNNVFGVSRDPVASYIERDSVDSTLSEALATTKQIVIYGSSKQGKTALLQRHLDEKYRCTYHCGPASSAEDIYRAFLRQLGVEIVTEKANTASKEATASIKSTFSAFLPFISKGEIEANAEGKVGKELQTTTKPIEFNLNAAQDVGELLLEVGGANKFFVLENFHYLTVDVQGQFAFDLRTFEEMGIRFIILGVWRENNRLIQFNGDLQDRVAEVPVEPWEKEDFARVADTGEKTLNISISDDLKERMFDEAHGSVAVVQELLKKFCEISGVKEVQREVLVLNDHENLNKAISVKVSDYASRHVRSLESIAAGSRSRRPSEDAVALYLQYYLVQVLLTRSYSELKDGIERKTLQELIREIHTHPDNVRTSDVTGTLKRLPVLQTNQNIVPPLLDYDQGTRRLKVVDSTLYFFIDNCDAEEVMAEIPHPDSLAGS